MESTYINIAVLGLKVSVADFSFYNSTAMLLLTLYLLLSERRENREIGRLFHQPIQFLEVNNVESSREIFGLRLVVNAIFFLPAVSIACNLIYHTFFIVISGFPWESTRLIRMRWPVLTWEVSCLVYVGYLTSRIIRFHGCTKDLVERFKIFSEQSRRDEGDNSLVLGSHLAKDHPYL
jgi:hypothetical protein